MTGARAAFSVPADATAFTPVTGSGAAARADWLAFRYVPTVTSVSPGHGSIMGGTLLRITGSGFGVWHTAVTVSMADKLGVTRPCNVVAVHHTEVLCLTVPAEFDKDNLHTRDLTVTVRVNGTATIFGTDIADLCPTFSYAFLT